MVVFMIQRQLTQEIDLISGNLHCDELTSAVKVGLSPQTYRRLCVLPEGLVAAGCRRHPNQAGLIDKIQQHLFVVTAQANYFLRIFLTEIQHELDTAGNIRAAIDQIAQKDQRVRERIARQHVEQTVKLGAAAMDVANDEGFHRSNSLSLWERVRERVLAAISLLNYFYPSFCKRASQVGNLSGLRERA